MISVIKRHKLLVFLIIIFLVTLLTTVLFFLSQHKDEEPSRGVFVRVHRKIEIMASQGVRG